MTLLKEETIGVIQRPVGCATPDGRAGANRLADGRFDERSETPV